MSIIPWKILKDEVNGGEGRQISLCEPFDTKLTCPRLMPTHYTRSHFLHSHPPLSTKTQGLKQRTPGHTGEDNGAGETWCLASGGAFAVTNSSFCSSFGLEALKGRKQNLLSPPPQSRLSYLLSIASSVRSPGFPHRVLFFLTCS